MSWTKQKLADWIYEEMQANGGDRRKAAKRVAERIVNSGQAKPFLDDLGTYLFLTFEREWTRRESEPRPNHPTPVPENYGRNLKAEAKVIAGAMVPIGNTGLRKPLGQITSEDALAIADYHAAMEAANRRKKVNWTTVASEIPEGETVGDAFSDLSEESRAFLRSIARIDSEAAA